jgi:UDP-N-acetylglucosamine acyltransferase
LKIHSTAIVAAKAILAENVEVGPFSIIGDDVEIGEGSKIQSHVVLEGRLLIGRHNLIGHGAVIGTPPQDNAFLAERQTGVRIGANNVIREHCTIHRGTADGSDTILGDDNFLMAGAHLGHNCIVGNRVIIANNCLLGGHVRVEDQAFLGGGCVFHQHIRVGRLALTQGASAFSMDVPPFVIAAERNQVFGINSVGIRRAGISAEERQEIKAAFKLVYLSGLNISEALKQAGNMKAGPAAREFIDFIAAAKTRGVCPYRGKGDNGAPGL